MRSTREKSQRSIRTRIRRIRKTRRMTRITRTRTRTRMRRRGCLNIALDVISYDQEYYLVNLRPVRYVGIEVKRVRQGVSRLRIICSNRLQ